jgi:hypothetical protein
MLPKEAKMRKVYIPALIASFLSCSPVGFSTISVTGWKEGSAGSRTK